MIEVTTISYTFDEEHLAVRVFIDHEKKCRRAECGVCCVHLQYLSISMIGVWLQECTN